MPQEDSIHQPELERKRQYWKTRITNWQASRLSQTEYCRRHELKFHQFVYWRRNECHNLKSAADSPEHNE